MPLYEFEYYDDNGDRFVFEDLFPSTADLSAIKSPCGKYDANKVPSSFAIQEGMTRKEKVSGTTKKRREFAQHCKSVRETRKKDAAPGTREHDSNELWMGNENLKGVLNPKSYIKSKHTMEAPTQASQPRPVMTPEIINI